MDIKQLKYVYFIGIGGIGMSALARYFKHIGCEVAGYDRTATHLTQQLEAEGMSVIYEDRFDEIASTFKTKETLLIYTPAIPKDLGILNSFKDLGLTLHKRSEVLGLLSQGKYTIAVAGTHGKTTTSSMVAHLLMDSGRGCSAFLGGITSNYNTNTLFGDNDLLVVEADEYDRSFLTLHPNISILTSADADHLDIYNDHQAMLETFGQFLDQTAEDGLRIVHAGLPFKSSVYYSADGQGQVYAENVRVEDGYFWFDYVGEHTRIPNIRLGIPGLHNVSNAVAATTAALHLEIPAEKIRTALGNFKGVKRRFEYIVRNEKQIYIDDYAHHPEELRAFLTAVRSLYPTKHLTVVFQPHLFTRTRDFMEGFAEVLSAADTLVLMEIYPARELPIEGVTSSALLDKVTARDKHLKDKEAVLEYIAKQKPELIVSVGAGNIDQLIEPIREILNG